MAKIEINDLNEEITISEEEIKHVNGGTDYLKIGDIDGESRLTTSTINYSWTDPKSSPQYTSLTWKI